MSEPALPRRDFLLGVAGIGGTVALAAHLRAIAAYAALVPEQAPWEFFTPEEAADFDAVSAQIVPTDETPGAREARVVRFADHALATAFKGNQAQFRRPRSSRTPSATATSPPPWPRSCPATAGASSGGSSPSASSGTSAPATSIATGWPSCPRSPAIACARPRAHPRRARSPAPSPGERTGDGTQATEVLVLLGW